MSPNNVCSSVSGLSFRMPRQSKSSSFPRIVDRGGNRRSCGSLPPKQAGFRLALRLAGMTVSGKRRLSQSRPRSSFLANKNKRKPKLPFLELSRL